MQEAVAFTLFRCPLLPKLRLGLLRATRTAAEAIDTFLDVLGFESRLRASCEASGNLQVVNVESGDSDHDSGQGGQLRVSVSFE